MMKLNVAKAEDLSMMIQWITLCIFICYIAFSYIEHYRLKSRVLPIATLLIISSLQ